MTASILLGLLGSLGHCAGMCSAVVILLDRQAAFQGSKFAWLLAHSGRLTTYALLGFLAGSFGQALWSSAVDLPGLQGLLSLLFAILAFYMAASFVGLLPSVDTLLSGLTRRWGRAMRVPRSASAGTPYLLGLLWGLLPCGLVLTALLPAVSASDGGQGALRMAAFGLATIPSLAGIRWLAGRAATRSWPRSLASLVMMAFGFQFAMRGFASLGLVGHFMLGSLMIW